MSLHLDALAGALGDGAIGRDQLHESVLRLGYPSAQAQLVVRNVVAAAEGERRAALATPSRPPRDGCASARRWSPQGCCAACAAPPSGAAARARSQKSQTRLAFLWEQRRPVKRQRFSRPTRRRRRFNVGKMWESPPNLVLPERIRADRGEEFQGGATRIRTGE
jgi:hypothetical protein